MYHGCRPQELNVRELTLATEDSRYGVRLQGEPDNERLGKRLKGEFKKVCDWLIGSLISVMRPQQCYSACDWLIGSLVSNMGPPQQCYSACDWLIGSLVSNMGPPQQCYSACDWLVGSLVSNMGPPQQCYSVLVWFSHRLYRSVSVCLVAGCPCGEDSLQ